MRCLKSRRNNRFFGQWWLILHRPAKFVLSKTLNCSPPNTTSPVHWWLNSIRRTTKYHGYLLSGSNAFRNGEIPLGLMFFRSAFLAADQFLHFEKSKWRNFYANKGQSEHHSNLLSLSSQVVRSPLRGEAKLKTLRWNNSQGPTESRNMLYYWVSWILCSCSVSLLCWVFSTQSYLYVASLHGIIKM